MVSIKSINVQTDSLIKLSTELLVLAQKEGGPLSKLNPGGHLVILVPAHQNLFGRFDKAVGHCRRYDINFFQLNKFKNAKVQKLIFLDLFGYILYFFNKFFFKDEVYPSKFKIFIWDKIFTPITIVIDYITRYKLGKNILCVYKKIE